MICSEEEAKKKWCPKVQFTIGPAGPPWDSVAYTNRAEAFNYGKTCCLGSGCMWWVWVNSAKKEGYCSQGGG